MAFKVFILFLLMKMIFAGPQVDLNSRIEDIFGGSSNRGAFGDIVEPENIAATEQPQILSGNNGLACKCVPYHLCKPSTTTDSRFFGEIDVRYGIIIILTWKI